MTGAGPCDQGLIDKFVHIASQNVGLVTMCSCALCIHGNAIRHSNSGLVDIRHPAHRDLLLLLICMLLFVSVGEFTSRVSVSFVRKWVLGLACQQHLFISSRFSLDV